MFADADALMAKGSFEDAAAKFEAVDREHPYSQEARRSIVMAAYAYYRAGKTPEAIASAERYVAMHPGYQGSASRTSYHRGYRTSTT